MNSSSAERSPASLKYIYDLPFFDRKEICRIFDENSQWETLGGGLMGYSSSELSEFGRVLYRGGSPTDALLTSWGNQNHTLLELFTLCARLYNGRAMKVLAKYVDPKYHAYMPDDTDFHATQLLVALDPPKLHQPGIPENINSPKKKVDDKNGGGGGDHGAADGKMGGAAGDGAKPAKPTDALSSSVGLLPPIAYAELTAATSGWDKRNMLGKGGFGTVYKGNWKNTAVAIKRMEHRPNEAYVESQMKQSLGEMRFLNSYRHDNILPLYGYCLDGPHPCLVYQFMTNGSLEDRILCRQRTPPLSWHLRFHMAKGVACGIQFLHSIGPQPLIHGDIKSANILLDRNFEAKVGDFGLAREMTTPGGAGPNASYVKVSRVHGTRPYLPDEYLRSKKLSTKVDTYSFGIVLFELATGLRAYEEQRQKKFLKDMVEEFEGITDKLKDAKGGGDNPDVFPVLVNLGRHCTERLAKKRPEMVEVLKSLEAAMPYATSSIRTLSTHVTGLPYLFELPMSRPGSLGIPPHTSYMTNRNSPEMRAGSPHWIGPGGPPPSGLPSPGGVRKSSQNSSPPVSQYPPGLFNQHAPSPSPHLYSPSPPHPPPAEPILIPTTNSNTPTTRPSIGTSPTSNSSNASNNMPQNQAPFSPPQNNQAAFPLTIDTVLPSPKNPPPPEFLLIQPSPEPVLPATVCAPIQEGNSNSDDDDMYLPLVLEHKKKPTRVPLGVITSASQDEENTDFDTVIPLITELGIKNDS